MKDGQPHLFAIDHDDYHAEHVGVTVGGDQFFLTTPFDPAGDEHPGCEFIALYLFDVAGKLIQDTIVSLGPRANRDEEARMAKYRSLLDSLGQVEFCRINIAPFSIERFGLQFGFIACPPAEEGEEWSVVLEPGDYMAFYPPWDSGEYLT